jgi:hypothetical protein
MATFPGRITITADVKYPPIGLETPDFILVNAFHDTMHEHIAQSNLFALDYDPPSTPVRVRIRCKCGWSREISAGVDSGIAAHNYHLSEVMVGLLKQIARNLEEEEVKKA